MGDIIRGKIEGDTTWSVSYRPPELLTNVPKEIFDTDMEVPEIFSNAMFFKINSSYDPGDNFKEYRWYTRSRYAGSVPSWDSTWPYTVYVGKDNKEHRLSGGYQENDNGIPEVFDIWVVAFNTNNEYNTTDFDIWFTYP